MPTINYRRAERADAALILDFILQLAQYEKIADQVEATPETIEHSLFDRNAAQVIFGMVDGKEVGFALYFYNFSTFTGRPGVYLEDLFVKPEYRGLGLGKGLLLKLVDIAKEQQCGRVEWVCLDWNKPSIDFYKSLGAKPMDDWTIYRLSEHQFAGLLHEGSKE